MRFPIVIHKDEGSSYGVTVPDLPGCFSGGATVEEAFTASEEAILSHIEVLLMDGGCVPKQRSLEEHQANADYADGVWALWMPMFRSCRARVCGLRWGMWGMSELWPGFGRLVTC